jgi:UDP:flavonoid glycosyltransferase YjiC (YdhE family)
VLIREPAEFGSLAAAVRTGVPHLQVAIGMSEMSRLFVDLTAEPLLELAATAGLPEAAVVDAAVAEPVLSSVPEPLDRAGDDAYDGRAVTFRYRDEVPGPAGPASAGGDPGDPWVYVTFGSVTGTLLPFRGVFRQALEGLADLPVRVFMTVGRQVDVADLGPLPANARVEGWWPQQDVLALASVVLGHGGFGTTMGAVAAGVPQVVAPIFSSDQVVNARHVAAVGVGRAMSPGPSTISSACEAVSVVLAEPGYGARAQSLAAAVAALPPAADAVSVVERAA